ncbi:hypothetical protein ACFE04_028903 [Oxalis oulophora]
MVCQGDKLVAKVLGLYDQISSLESLKPCKDVNTLFTELVLTCMPPAPNFDVANLCKSVQDIRSNLIRLCGEAEGLLESHFSTILNTYENPIHHLNLFPYYSNYIKLGQLEFQILTQHINTNQLPQKIAFIGSGPLPLTSIVLATNHLTTTTFHNYDIDSSANSLALRLVATHPDLSKRMLFHTTDIMNVNSDELKEYEVIFLAALVGMSKEEKVKVIEHLAKHMAPGAILMLRSAHGARAFLYPVVDPCDLKGFQVLSVFHPTDEVINSVVIARKYPIGFNLIDQTTMILPNYNCKCLEKHAFINHEELAMEEQLS